MLKQIFEHLSQFICLINKKNSRMTKLIQREGSCYVESMKERMLKKWLEKDAKITTFDVNNILSTRQKSFASLLIKNWVLLFNLLQGNI